MKPVIIEASNNYIFSPATERERGERKPNHCKPSVNRIEGCGACSKQCTVAERLDLHLS